MTGIGARAARTWQRIRTEPRLGRNVLMLVILVVLAGVSGVIILGHQGSGLTNWPWNNRFTFTAVFSDAAGVTPGQGQEVRMAGVQVGAIESASLTPDGKAALRLGIDPKYQIYGNATLVLRPKSPLNEMYIEVNPGGPPGMPLAAGGTIPVGQTDSPVTIDQVTQHLDQNTLQALTALIDEADVALTHAPASLASGLSATDQVARDLRPVAAALQQRRNTLAQLVSELSTISGTVGNNDQRLAQLATALQQTLQALGDQRSPLNSTLLQLPDLTNQLKQATDSVQALSGQLNPTLDDLRTATGTLPAALAQLNSTVATANTVIDKANPVVTAAGPVVTDLRPLVANLNAALPALRDISVVLNPLTAAVVPGLPDVNGFFYNTAAVTSLRDANGGLLRGIAVVTPDTIPFLANLSTGAK